MDLDVLAIDVRNLKALLTNITPLMPVLTKLAQNPQLIEKLADDAGAAARDLSELSAAVSQNGSAVESLREQVAALAPLPAAVSDHASQFVSIEQRIAALEQAAATPHPEVAQREHRQEPPSVDSGTTESAPLPGPDLGAGGES